MQDYRLCTSPAAGDGVQYCREGFTGKYLGVPRLLDEINNAKANASYVKLLKSYAKYDLLLFDDLSLSPMTADELSGLK